MSKDFGDFKYLLIAACAITNFILTIPTKTLRTQVIAKTLINRDICVFGSQKLIILDKFSIYRSHSIHSENQ